MEIVASDVRAARRGWAHRTWRGRAALPPRPRPRLGFLFALLVLTSATVACERGGQTTEAVGTTDTSADTAGATGASAGATESDSPESGNARSGNAVVAPLNVPAIPGGPGTPLERAEQAFKKACGGQLCVKLIEVHPPNVEARCQFFSGTSPPEGSRILRDSVVKLVFKVDPTCAPIETTTSTRRTGSTTASTRPPTTTTP